MRQKDDKSFAELLNRLREGNHTDQDIKDLKKTVTCEKLKNHGVSYQIKTSPGCTH